MEKTLSFAAGAQTPPAIARPNSSEIALDKLTVNAYNIDTCRKFTRLKHQLQGYGPAR